jgi:hypothetical protein
MPWHDKMVEQKTISGGCLCGKFRYRLRSRPININDCHCVDCRRANAAPFVTWGSIKARDFEIVSGKLRKVSFANRVRSFTTCCSTPILFQEMEDSEWSDVTIVSLDDPTPYRPVAAIWTEDKLPWVVLNPETPNYPQKQSDDALIFRHSEV